MFFNLLLFLYLLLISPKLLFDRYKGKRHPEFFQRLGLSIPSSNELPLIWIHAVSVGEIKAAQPLFRSLKKEFPGYFFLITTTTKTGQEEAKRVLQEASAFRYLPFDFTWIVRRWAKVLKPKLFVLIESDFWPNLLTAIQKVGGKTVLVSGKLSERSARRFSFFSYFSRKLFQKLDRMIVQNDLHRNRFAPLVDNKRLFIGGNLKLDIAPEPVDKNPWEGLISLPIVTIASTHRGEEEAILNALEGLDLFFFLAPRHPERSEEVAALLMEKKISFTRFSEPFQSNARVIVVDSIGKLPLCYSLSSVVIVGGSFIPEIGGHNILEPCLYGKGPLFGPYMFSQIEFVERVLEAKAGRQVTLEELRGAVLDQLSEERDSLKEGVKQVISLGKGATEKTLFYLKDLF